MLSDEQLRIVGDAVFLGVLTEPFFHVATDALMNREYGKALVAYLIGSIPATAGLIVLGILSVGPFTPSAIGRWIQPIVVRAVPALLKECERLGARNRSSNSLL